MSFHFLNKMTIIAYFVLLLVCIMTFLGLIHQDVPYPYQAIPIELNITLTDSVTSSSNNYVDSISAKLQSIIHKSHETNYEHLLNDLRQESNNIINKWNAWFSFWIALLATLVGIVPVIIQFKLHNHAEKRINNAINSLSSYEEKAEKNITKKINQELHKTREQISIQERKLKKIEIAHITNSICIAWDEQLICDSKDRIAILRNSLIRLNNCLSSYIHECEQMKIEENLCDKLLHILIHVHALMNKLNFLFVTHNKTRKAEMFKGFLKEQILSLAKNEKILTDSDFKDILVKIKYEIFIITNELCTE